VEPKAANCRNTVDSSSALPPAARIAVLVVGVLAVVAWLFLAFVHLHDRFNVGHVAGTLLALADRAREGVLYPPFFDGHSYGGTRMMPVPMVLYAAAISFGGDLLAPAKLVDLVASAALVAVLVAVLRRRGASMTLSLGLAATVVTSQVFLGSAAGIRPESLPTMLQLSAVALVAFRPTRAAVVVAAIFCAVALFAKFTALWAPFAIGAWLLTSNRARLAVFAFTLVTGIVALGALFTVASDGRMLTNLLGLGGAAVSLGGVVKAPLKAVDFVLQYAQASVVLLPALVLGLFLAGRASRPTIFQVALVAAAAILLVVMADAGTSYNHLLDVIVLLPIVAYEVVHGLARRMADPRPAWTFLAALVLVGTSAALAANSGSNIAVAAGLSAADAPLDARPLEAELAGSGSVLAEDAYIHLYRGEVPPVLDPFMLVRVERRDPTVVEPLLTRIATGSFDVLVLRHDLEDPASESWYRDYAFGSRFYEAARKAYRLCTRGAAFYVYVARSRPCPGS
jgi:hypothetical protein